MPFTKALQVEQKLINNLFWKLCVELLHTSVKNKLVLFF